MSKYTIRHAVVLVGLMIVAAIVVSYSVGSSTPVPPEPSYLQQVTPPRVTPAATLTPARQQHLVAECERLFPLACRIVTKRLGVDVNDARLFFDKPMPVVLMRQCEKAGIVPIGFTKGNTIIITTAELDAQVRSRRGINTATAVIFGVLAHELVHAGQAKALGVDDLTAEWRPRAIARMQAAGWHGSEKDLKGVCMVLLEGQAYQLERELGIRVEFANPEFSRPLLPMMELVSEYGHKRWLAVMKDGDLDSVLTAHKLAWLGHAN
jgi:hypothetical protein